MAGRLAGALAVLGGVAWLAKVAAILDNGGTDTTGGVVGLLLFTGLVPLGAVAAAWGWCRASAFPRGVRVLAALGGLLALVAIVNLPIPVAWLVIGHGWLAEEVGILLVAALALVLGVRWLRDPDGSPFTRRPLAREDTG